MQSRERVFEDELCRKLLEQAAAHNELLRAVRRNLENLEYDKAVATNYRSLVNKFLRNRPQLIEEFADHVCKESEDDELTSAKDVSAFALRNLDELDVQHYVEDHKASR